jgi:hypothetical protein
MSAPFFGAVTESTADTTVSAPTWPEPRCAPLSGILKRGPWSGGTGMDIAIAVVICLVAGIISVRPRDLHYYAAFAKPRWPTRRARVRPTHPVPQRFSTRSRHTAPHAKTDRPNAGRGLGLARSPPGPSGPPRILYPSHHRPTLWRPSPTPIGVTFCDCLRPYFPATSARRAAAETS